MKTLTILLLCLTIASCCKYGNPGPPIVVSKPDTIADGGYIGIQAVALADTVGFVDETLITFNHAASYSYVRGEDAPYFGGAGNTSLATMADTIVLAVNVQPYKAGHINILRLRARTIGGYYIHITRSGSIPKTLHVWLKDSLLADSADLTKGKYTFMIDNANVADQSRFKIIIR